MKDLQEFKDFLPIDYHEEMGAYGHFPFMLFSENLDGKTTIAGLVVDSVGPCYKAFHTAMKSGAQRCYMSIDYPAREDMKTDYIGVFSFDGEHMNVSAIPYNTETGERLPEIAMEDSESLQIIMKEFSIAVLREAGLINNK